MDGCEEIRVPRVALRVKAPSASSRIGFHPWPHSAGEGFPFAGSVGRRRRWIQRRCGCAVCRPAAAVLMGPLAWELPRAASAAVKRNY